MKGSKSLLSNTKLINISDISKTIINTSFFLKFISIKYLIISLKKIKCLI